MWLEYFFITSNFEYSLTWLDIFNKSVMVVRWCGMMDINILAMQQETSGIGDTDVATLKG